LEQLRRVLLKEVEEVRRGGGRRRRMAQTMISSLSIF
jgi:hypothetical protein